MSTTVNFGADGSGDSINDTIALLQAELDELLQQKATIKLRMRNLRRHLGMLKVDSGSAHTRSRKRRRSVTAAHRAENLKIRRLHSELSRACRIALMELGGTATAEELYAAIMRRGSFSFSLLKENPTAAIARALNAMARSSEVVRASDLRWTYQPQLANSES
ncbi:MAG TPA: hypothetical protein VFA90_19620 [Terriglobales bacterium]|nr:hypothetical protein [Terriglobales bacterium]